MPAKTLSVGIDLGGTGIKLGLVDSHGKLITTLKFSTPSKSNPEAVVSLVASQVRVLLDSTKKRALHGIGVGAAGDIDPETGTIRISPNLGWKNVPFKALLQKKLKHPVIVDNDANVAAWAAYIVEAKRQVENLLCVTIGTGIGGGIIIGGKLYRGTTGTAGEIGHMTLFPNGYPCNCGNRGCVERYVGARALSESAIRAIRAGEPTLIPKLVKHDLNKIEPLILQQAAEQNDRLALRLWKEAGECLGISMAALVNVLNPEWIVLAGGLSRAGALLLEPLVQTLKQRSFPMPASAVKVVISRLDQDLGVVGAGLIASEKKRS